MEHSCQTGPLQGVPGHVSVTIGAEAEAPWGGQGPHLPPAPLPPIVQDLSGPHHVVASVHPPGHYHGLWSQVCQVHRSGTYPGLVHYIATTGVQSSTCQQTG